MVVSFLFVGAGNAQDAVYQYARPGYATKTVYVWGAVGMPGVWRVEQETNLLELLSISKITSVGTSRRRILRIYRRTDAQPDEIFNERMERILNGEREYPELLDGDIVLVEEKTKFSFQTLVATIGAISALVLLAIRIGELAS